MFTEVQTLTEAFTLFTVFFIWTLKFQVELLIFNRAKAIVIDVVSISHYFSLSGKLQLMVIPKEMALWVCKYISYFQFL